MAGDRRGVMLLDLRRGRIVQLCHELRRQPGQELGRNMRVPQRVAGHDVRVLPNRRNSTGERAGMVALVPAIAGWLHKQRRHEGIETAVAVALAFASDIRAGTTTVVAALSASGVKNFQPWPASTTAVVVAADRDEGVGPDGRPRDKAGEDAARELCMRVREHTNFAGIALPGSPGEKVDWLDIMLRDDIDAVLTGIYAAVRFEPTTEELERVAARRSRKAELAEIAAAYPLPRMHTPHLTYAHTADGKVKVHKVFGSGDEMKLIPIATPFGVLARLRHADQANAYGLRCVVQDMDGEQRAVDFRRGSLQKM